MSDVNPFAQDEALYAWRLACNDVCSVDLDNIIAWDEVVSVTTSVLDGENVIMVYALTACDAPAMRANIALLAQLSQQPIEVQSCERVVVRDWVAESQAGFVPLHVDRFMVAGSHHPIRRNRRSTLHIMMDAGAAFGTGEHGTTSGCLKAIAHISKYYRYNTVLDMGCGTAILGMGAALLQPHSRVLAVDNDAVAVHVAKKNVTANRLASRITALVSQGFSTAAIRTFSPRYDMIIANILARPVKAMALDMRRHIQPGGVLILSGFYPRHVASILYSYRQQGFALIRHDILNGWSTLTLREASMNRLQPVAI